uniref:hypothetical protein n=1 Tax=Klebsiella pneumoniae TaxID=573 RepID=UPI003D387683
MTEHDLAMLYVFAHPETLVKVKDLQRSYIAMLNGECSRVEAGTDWEEHRMDLNSGKSWFELWLSCCSMPRRTSPSNDEHFATKAGFCNHPRWWFKHAVERTRSVA